MRFARRRPKKMPKPNPRHAYSVSKQERTRLQSWENCVASILPSKRRIGGIDANNISARAVKLDEIGTDGGYDAIGCKMAYGIEAMRTDGNTRMATDDRITVWKMADSLLVVGGSTL